VSGLFSHERIIAVEIFRGPDHAAIRRVFIQPSYTPKTILIIFTKKGELLRGLQKHDYPVAHEILFMCNDNHDICLR
jgi:hypothetical protein